MSSTPTEPSNDPTFRTLDLGAEAKKMMGPQWNAPELAYQFGDRKFYLRTGDAAIYASSPDFND